MAHAAKSESGERDPALKEEPAIDDEGMIDELALGLGLSSGALGGTPIGHASRGGPSQDASPKNPHGEPDGGDGDLFDEVFGGDDGMSGEAAASAPVRGSSTPKLLGAQRAAELLLCAICQCTSQDPDLGDSSMAADRLTPFVRMQSHQHLTCDHCESLIRYQELPGPCKRVQALQGASEVEKREYLERLACYLALKRSEAQTKVRAVTLARTASVMSAYQSILQTLLAKSDLAPMFTASGSGPTSILGLRDYMKRWGNPLSNGDVVLEAMVADEVQLVVATSKGFEKGRRSLGPPVASKADGVSGGALAQLRNMTVDNLESIKLAQHMVSEFACRERWKMDLFAGLHTKQESNDLGTTCRRKFPRSRCAAANEDDGDRSTATSFVSTATTPQVPKPASQAEQARSPTPKTARSAPDTAAAASDSSAVPPGRPANTPVKSPEETRKPGASPSKLGATLASPSSSGDANVTKRTKRLWELASTFAVAEWRRLVRGKEKALSNFVGYVQGDIQDCMKIARRTGCLFWRSSSKWRARSNASSRRQ